MSGHEDACPGWCYPKGLTGDVAFCPSRQRRGWSQPHSMGSCAETLLLHPLNSPNCRHCVHTMLPPTSEEPITTALCYQSKLVFLTSRTSHFLKVERSVSDLLTRTHPSCPTFPPPSFSLRDWGKAHSSRLGSCGQSPPGLQGSQEPSHNDTRMDQALFLPIKDISRALRFQPTTSKHFAVWLTLIAESRLRMANSDWSHLQCVLKRVKMVEGDQSDICRCRARNITSVQSC